MRRSGIYIFLALCIVAGVFVYGCENIELTSKWLDRDISIDGDDVDWKNTTVFLENTRVAVGLFNDEDYLYISLSPWDARRQNLIINKGLIIWFDPAGNHEKRFGICFPLEKEYETVLMVRQNDRKESEKTLQAFKELQDSLEIIARAEEKPIRMDLAEARATGISVGVGNSDGRLFYELKVPIHSGSGTTYAINPNGTKPFNIGFETPEVSLEASTEDTFDDYEEEDRGTGMLRRTRSSSVASRSRQMSDMLHENLQLWTNVRLSAKPPSGAR